MGVIIPRWEWRTFGTADFGEAETKIRKSGEARVRKSDEVYILSHKSMDNTKVRDDLMDIKTLQNTNDDTLEQWMPVLKAAFPLEEETLQQIFRSFNVSLPKLERTSYSFDQYINELVKPCEDLVAVDVKKERLGYMINGTIVEIAEVNFNGKPYRTIAVEHEDPKLVYDTVCELGLNDHENINYLRAMKKSVGMED